MYDDGGGGVKHWTSTRLNDVRPSLHVRLSFLISFRFLELQGNITRQHHKRDHRGWGGSVCVCLSSVNCCYHGWRMFIYEFVLYTLPDSPTPLKKSTANYNCSLIFLFFCIYFRKNVYLLKILNFFTEFLLLYAPPHAIAFSCPHVCMSEWVSVCVDVVCSKKRICPRTHLVLKLMAKCIAICNAM